MKHNYSVQYDNLMLRPLEEHDIENLRNWRNDPETTKFLRPISYITKEMQEKWFQSYLDNPSETAFAIVETEKLNRMIGSVSLYDLTENSAEIGKFMIGDTEARGCGSGSKSIAAAVYIAFIQMGLKKVISSIHRENIPSYKSFAKIGFQKIGSHPCVVDGIEDEFELLASDFKNTKLL